MDVMFQVKIMGLGGNLSFAVVHAEMFILNSQNCLIRAQYCKRLLELQKASLGIREMFYSAGVTGENHIDLLQQ